MEQWRKIKWAKHYEVSSLGRVRSLPHKDRRGYSYPGRVLAAGVNPVSRYKMVGLSVGGVVHDRYVHRLVLESFRGRPRGKQEACHRNGKRGDNRLRNLRWGSRSSNALDAIRHGRVFMRGTQIPHAKLTDRKVRWLRTAGRRSGMSYRALGRRMGVTHGRIIDAMNGTAWRHVA